jgi:hypothetical protein
LAEPTYELIDSIELTAAASVLDITGIPATYRDLVVIAALDCANNSRPMVYFNNSGAGYYGTAASWTGSYFEVAYPRIEPLYNAATQNPFSVKLEVFDYAQTNKWKYAFTSGNVYDQGENGTWVWQNTSAITSIKIQSSSGGNYVAGGTMEIYGVKG